MGCHFLLQEIFLTQGLNPGLPHCRQTLYCLSHQGRSESDSVVSNSLRPHGLHSPWNSPGQNTEVGSRSLFQGTLGSLRNSLAAQTVKCLPTMRETWVRSLGREDPLEKEMKTHSSIHAWKIPWTKEPGGLESIESQRVRHN